MNETKHSFVLASSSPRRIELLNNIKVFPKIIYSSDINEDIKSKENPEKYKAEAEATKSQLGEMEGKEELDEFYAGGASVDPVMGAYAMGIFGAVFSTIIASVYRSFKKDEKLKSMKDSDVAKMAAKDKEFQASPEAQQTLKGEAEELAADAKMNIAEGSKLNEALKTIKVLKSELNEINLLNAKLLYTNKIFKTKNLNESQKVKVLTSFDKAKNVGEVKMVFETLNEGIKVSKNIIKENLGRASKGTMTPNVNKPIVESNEAFARMQKLAGII
jgi:predicted  nucleic acid-binding Zn-ribbon protein